MKKAILMFAAALPLLACNASADNTSVTIYGILDIGPTHVDNVGGKTTNQMDAGTLQQSRLGFKGEEALGGGMTAFFQLESGFNIDTGMLATANNLFSRDARIGLRGDFGMISLGRQANATVDALAPYSAAMLGYGPTYMAAHPGNHDRILNIPTDNTIKYTTPTFAGFNAIVAYGFGEQPGDTRQNSTRNAALTYKTGAFSMGASYLWQSGSNVTAALLAPGANPYGPTGAADVLRSTGIGAGYTLLSGTYLHGILSLSKFGLAGSTVRSLELGIKYPVGPWVLGTDYTRTRVTGRADYDNLILSAAYYFSKRTNLYATVAGLNADGTNYAGNPLAAQLFTLGASSTGHQRALHLGVRQVF